MCPLLYMCWEAFEFEDLDGVVGVDVVKEPRDVKHKEGGSVSCRLGGLDSVDQHSSRIDGAVLGLGSELAVGHEVVGLNVTLETVSHNLFQ